MKIKFKNVLPKWLISVLRKIKNIKNGNYFYFLWIFPIQRNKITVCSYYGKGYGDNGKYIVSELINQNLDVDIVWLLNKKLIENSYFPEQVRIARYGSLRGLYELATSKVWIDNSRKIFFPPKRKSQYYIQTWHSPLRLKKIEKDAEHSLSNNYIKMAKKDSKNINLLISGCDFSWKIYRDSFWYDGEILKCGTPRCDLLLQEDYKIEDKVYDFYKISRNKKIVLFAPTFRSNKNIEAYLFDFNRILVALQERFKQEWILLIRLHPNVSSLSNQIGYTSTIINATDYDDMQELLRATEILITDYSSSMFDMAISKKICFVHGKDIKEYIEKERELYFAIEELPFKSSTTDQDLIENILGFDKAEYEEKLTEFSKKINLYEDGLASKSVVGKIEHVIGI